jgi:hypothetical protein
MASLSDRSHQRAGVSGFDDTDQNEIGIRAGRLPPTSRRGSATVAGVRPPHGGGDVRINTHAGAPLIVSRLAAQELTFLRRSFTERGVMGRNLVRAKLALEAHANAEARG